MLLNPLFRSRKLLDIIGIAKTWGSTPADVLGIQKYDSFAYYCVNEACTYVYSKMQPDKDGNIEEPIFPSDREESKINNPGLNMLLGL